MLSGFILDWRISLRTGLIGGTFAALLETIIKGTFFNFNQISHFFAGYIYYAPIAIVVSFLLSLIISLLYFFIRKTDEIRNIEAILFSATVVHLSGQYLTKILIREIGARLGLHDFFLTSITIIILFCISFLFWQVVSKTISLITAKKTLALITMYFIVLAALSGFRYLNTDNENLAGDFKYARSPIPNKPNIIFILIDALRYDCLSCNGSENQTPTIDGLSEDGILFSNAFSNCGWTKPSIASIITSLYPVQHNVTTPHMTLNSDLATMAKTLRTAGYYTVGLHNNPHLIKSSNFNSGFLHYRRLTEWELPLITPGSPKLEHLKIYTAIAKKLSGKSNFNFVGYLDASKTTKEVINWIDKNREKKYFLYIHYMDPHSPYCLHPYKGEYFTLSKYKKRRGLFSPKETKRLFDAYKGEVRFADSSLSLLFNYLKNIGQYDSSLIILTADHGESFGEKGLWSHGELYESIIHIPFIVKLPGEERRGVIDSSLVQSIDFAPTIVKFIGAEPPEEWEGKDLFGGEENGFILAHLDAAKKKVHVYRNLKEKLFFYEGKGQTESHIEYYDIIADPGEENNLSKNPDYLKETSVLIDSLISIEERLLLKAVNSTEITLDKETIGNLKALGYLEQD